MKSQIALALTLFFFGISSQAKQNSVATEPPNLVGQYQMDLENFEVVQLRRELVIFSGTQESNQLIKDYRAKGYACQNIDGRHVKCNKFLPKMNLIGVELTADLKKWDGKLTVLAPLESAELINDAPFISEWEIKQPAIWNGTKYHEMHFVFQKTTGPTGLMKFKLVSESDDQSHFYLVNDQVAFQHLGSLKLDPEMNAVLSDRLNYVLEIKFQKQ